MNTDHSLVKADKYAAINGARDYLAKTYPDIFNRENPKPLAIGILGQIRAVKPEEFTVTNFRRVLHVWTLKFRYLKATANGEYRYNLDGTQAALITEGEKQYSSEKIVLLDKSFNEKKAEHAQQEKKAKHKALMAQHQLNRAVKKAKHEAHLVKEAEEKKAKVEPIEPKVEVAPVLKVKKICKAKPLAVEPTKTGPVIVIKKRRTLSLKQA